MTEVKPTEPGQDLRLTLDANIQDKAEEVLAEVGEEWKPKGATAIVMDPRDGGVLALANWPRVNANEPGDAPDYRAPEPRDRRHLRAGLDLQGVHGRGRAGGEGGHARHRVQPRRRRSRSPTARSASRTRAAT